MPRYLHAQVYAVMTNDSEPMQEVFSAEVNEEEPDEAALKFAAWLRELAAAVEQGLRE